MTTQLPTPEDDQELHAEVERIAELPLEERAAALADAEAALRALLDPTQSSP
jgi:hypothetical protein